MSAHKSRRCARFCYRAASPTGPHARHAGPYQKAGPLFASIFRRHGVGRASIAAAVVVVSAAALSSGASAQPSATSGVELITGQTNSVANYPTVPLTASGLVAGTGSLTFGSHTNTLTFNVGTIHVSKGQATKLQSTNAKTCTATGASILPYTVIGGTGAFAGATGSGQATVLYTVKEPRFAKGKNKGKCNFNATPLSAHTTFWASGPLTL